MQIPIDVYKRLIKSSVDLRKAKGTIERLSKRLSRKLEELKDLKEVQKRKNSITPVSIYFLSAMQYF